MGEQRQPASLDYVYEKLRLAVGMLASDPGTIQERLASTYQTTFNRLFSVDLPEDLRERYRNVCEQMDSYYGDRRESVNVSDAEAAALARDIVFIFTSLAERDPLGHWQQHPLAMGVTHPD